jgi:glycosyltransferase involved in cell wall biosynthesis
VKKVMLFGEGANGGTGISRYIRTIAKGIQNSEVDFEYIVATRNFGSIPHYDKNGIKYKINPLKGKLQDLVRKLPTGDNLLFGQSDVVHEPGYNLCRVSNSTRIVLTVHDVGWRIDTTPYGLTKKWIEKAETAIQQSSIIITPTKTVKNDVIRFFQYNPDDIFVIPHGIETIFTTNEIETYRISLPEEYWLFVGTINVRKNMDRAIIALSSLSKKLPLVIAGERTQDAEKLVKDAEKLGVKLIMVSGTTDLELKEIYRKSKGLIYPSLWEGFGLPIIEAASVGTPIITSNNTAMREIGKSYSLLVDPTNIQDIAQAFQSVLDMDITTREELIRRGKSLVKDYTWEKSIEAHKRLYEMM